MREMNRRVRKSGGTKKKLFWKRNLKREVMSRSLMVNFIFIFIFPFHLIFFFFFFLHFLFLEQLGLRFISHTVTSVTSDGMVT